MSAPFVLLYGATGLTGRDIIHGLLRVGGLRIGAITRSDSSSTALEFEKLGIEIVELDVSKETEEQVAAKLKGVDIIVSVVSMTALESQRPLFRAAKAAGVQRVVPSDFGTPADEGVMLLRDLKLGIRRYIQELGLGYTWIDVAWWKQLSLPHPPSQSKSMLALLSYRVFGDGAKPFAVTDRRRIGDFVGRIIKDERTLNQYVFCHEDTTTTEQTWDLAKELSPDGHLMVADKTHVSAEELQGQVKAARAAREANPGDIRSLYGQFMVEYNYSMHIRGDDTLAKAKELGALDARELYPDLKTESLREYAQAFYADPTAFLYGLDM